MPRKKIIRDYKFTFIYALIDPNSKEVRYVGKSFDPVYRLSYHLKEAKSFKKKTKKSTWIKELIEKNQKPILYIIEQCRFEIWEQEEKYWISYYKNLNYNLTNETTGGESSKKFSDDIKKQMSDKLRANWQNPEYRKMMSEAKKKNWQDPEYRKTMAESKKKQAPPSEETREKLRITTTRLWQNPEHRRITSEKAALKWQDEQFRQKMNLIIEKRKGKCFLSEETKEVIRQKTSLRWQDPEYREKVLKKMSESRNKKNSEKKENQKGEE